MFCCFFCSHFVIVPSVRGDGQWDLQGTAKDRNFPLTKNCPNVNLLLFPLLFSLWYKSQMFALAQLEPWRNSLKWQMHPGGCGHPVQFHTAWSTGGAIVDYFVIKAWKTECMWKRDFIDLLLSSWCWKLSANLNCDPQNIYYYLVFSWAITAK